MNIVAFGEMAKQLAEAQRKAAEEGRRQGEMASILAKMMTDMPQALEDLAGEEEPAGSFHHLALSLDRSAH